MINNIKSKYVNKLLNDLTSLSNLSSLTIILGDLIEDENIFYQSIFRLPVLKYCKISFNVRVKCTLAFTTNKFSPIEHLIINNDCDYDQFIAILSYVPQLRRLHCHSLSRLSNTDKTIILKYLTYLEIELKNLSFSEFEQCIINLFPQLEVLYVSRNADVGYLDAHKWKRLTSSHLRNLRILDVQHICSAEDMIYSIYTNLIDRFISSFWIERKWFLAYQYLPGANGHVTKLHSINPYSYRKIISFRIRFFLLFVLGGNITHYIVKFIHLIKKKTLIQFVH